MMNLLDGVGLRPSRRPLALRGLRISLPRPLAWHAGVSSVYTRRPLRLAARRPLQIACSRASDDEECPSYTAYTPEAVSRGVQDSRCACCARHACWRAAELGG